MGVQAFILVLVEIVLKLLDLLLVLLDYFLTEVAPFGEFVFNLLVVSQILRQSFDYGVHLVILVHLVLGLLRLVLQFSSERGVLNNSELGCAHQLVFVHVEHFDFDCPYLEEHLLAQVVNLDHLVLLNSGNLFFVGRSLGVSFVAPEVSLLHEFLLHFLVFFKFIFRVLVFLDSLVPLGEDLLLGSVDVFDLLLYTRQGESVELAREP